MILKAVFSVVVFGSLVLLVDRLIVIILNPRMELRLIM
jgi:hypothetical protein